MISVKNKPLKIDFRKFSKKKSPICPVLHSSKNYLLLAGGTLKINDITEDDAGTYTCIADNGNETIEAQADLIVQGM